MKPIGIQVFDGPSLYAKEPVVCLRVEQESLPYLSTAVFRQRIDERLPEDEDWHAVRAALKRLAQTSDKVGRGDVLAALTRALQDEPFGIVPPSRQQPSRLAGHIDVLVGIEDPDMGEAAAIFACRIAEQLFDEVESESIAHARNDLAQGMKNFQRQRGKITLSGNIRLLMAAARARGVPARKLVRGYPYILFGHGAQCVRMGQNAGDRTSAFASRLSNDKFRTSQALARAGIPVPDQRLIERDEDVTRAIAEIGFPLVVKGRTGSRGHSVTAGIRSAEEIAPALAKARLTSASAVMEAHIAGEDHRLSVVDGKLIAAVRRRRGHVIGDGQQTIEALADEENRRRFALNGASFWLVPLAIDEESRRLLADQGFNPQSVPAPGQAVRLRESANVSQGALPEDVTEEVHPETRALAERAARTVGLDIAGIDVMTTDISRPLTETGGVIIEVNHFPGVGLHTATETPRYVSLAIMDYLFPAPQRGRLPLAAVTGTNGRTTTCRMLARVLSEAGFCTAQVTTAGAYVGRERLLKGDYANAAGAHAVLQDPRVEAAVLETACGGIVDLGLGWDVCDVAVVTNIADDHFSQNGIDTRADLTAATGLVVECAQQAVVLDADDAHCRVLAERASAPLWWTSCARPVPVLLTDHIAAGGNALLLEGEGQDDFIVHACSRDKSVITRLSQLPATPGGSARLKAKDAMTASAAALAMGVPIETLCRALAEMAQNGSMTAEA